MLNRYTPLQSASPSAYAKAHGKVDSVALLQSMEERIAASDEQVKAFVTKTPMTAPEETQPASGPLMGLPVGVKDIIATTDLPTEMGSPLYADFQPKSDAAIVSLVKRAGGRVCHKTVTTEFAYLTPNITRNPHNLNHTPGGSSSGSAAAVAAGYLPLAIGTQTGGSVIRPASYCGVFGFKPSFTALPMHGVSEFSRTLDTLGLFTANLCDMELFWSALNDTPKSPHFQGNARIGVMKTHIWSDASQDAQQSITQASDQWAKSGHELIELDWLPIFTEAFEAHEIIQNYEACRALAWEMDTHPDQLSPILLQTLQAGLDISHIQYLVARHVAKAARKALAEQQKKVNVILTPSAPGTAPKGLSSTGVSTFNRFWTLMGVPCMHLPTYIADSGLPIGVQLVGAYEKDSELLSVSSTLWEQV